MTSSSSTTLQIMQRFRIVLLERIQPLTTEQLNQIPNDAGNNIIWNLAHMNTTVFNLCYRDSGLPIPVADVFYRPFLSGTRPDGFIDPERIDQIKRQFAETLPIIAQQLEDGYFTNYTIPEKIQAAFGIQLKSVPDALEYILHHEGIHFHAINALLKKIDSR